MSNGKIIVVGGGLAGLMATIKIAESGKQVDLFSLVPVKDLTQFARKVESTEP